jgi:hypothetical protein
MARHRSEGKVLTALLEGVAPGCLHYRHNVDGPAKGVLHLAIPSESFHADRGSGVFQPALGLDNGRILFGGF